jgi:hypothetical protein
VPLANLHNLGRVLSEIGQRIDPEEDVVFLYLSAPALTDVEIKPRFETLDFVPIHASQIESMLDDAGIKWRVIVLSACAADGFVERLSGPATLVIAAAGTGSRGHGCKGDADYTAFGKAFFGEALRDTYSLREAFDRAQARLAEEGRGALRGPVEPAMHAGAEISAKLDALATHLRQQSAGAAPPSALAMPKVKVPKATRR